MIQPLTEEVQPVQLIGHSWLNNIEGKPERHFIIMSFKNKTTEKCIFADEILSLKILRYRKPE